MAVAKKSIAVLTGSGISAESGLRTFRDSNGLWENHRIEDVATPEGFERNPELVLQFYNERRRKIQEAQPNEAHRALKALEEKYTVQIITQNVDDLHERAGSSNVLHLHGVITKAQSINDENEIIDIGYRDISLGDCSPSGAQLRPHIVWFGEAVPMILPAQEIVSHSDIVIIIGTSMLVYPAASLVQFAPSNAQLYLIDTNIHHDVSALERSWKLTCIEQVATIGVVQVVQELLCE